jgi:hypothetical protein
MSRMKTHKSFLKKLAQLLLILLLLASSSSMVLAQGAPENASPENTQQGATLSYEEAQQKRMQGAESIVFSEDRSTADVIRSYPFLRNAPFKGVNAVRVALSLGTGVELPSPARPGYLPSQVKLLFVYNTGPLVPYSNACVLSVCGLYVYADDGTGIGYKKALDWKYLGSAIHVARANGEVELFIEDSGKQHDFVLQSNSTFAMKLSPHPRDCCGPAFTHPLP